MSRAKLFFLMMLINVIFLVLNFFIELAHIQMALFTFNIAILIAMMLVYEDKKKREKKNEK